MTTGIVTAANDTATVAATSTIAINATSNDTDTNGKTLSVVSLNTTGTKGLATIDPATGMIDYSPNGAFAYLSAGQTATDTLKYTVSDGVGDTSTATVTITVTGVNTPPVANADSATMTAATSYVNIAPLANDTDVNKADKLTLVSVNTTGTRGQVIINSTYNTITYEPHQVYAYLSVGETATDTFQYTVSDGQGGTSTATETVTITGVNVAPKAGTVTASTAAYTAVSINPLAMVTDTNLDDIETLTGVVTTGTKGSVTFNSATGLIAYAPNDAFDYLSVGKTATDTFQYTVSDGHGGTSTGKVSVVVSGVNVAPVATSQTGAIAANGASVW
ncbi:MAG: tandem-95 repeat protein, partial [Proteobacteria bacterium]|nr:tandem-95 repeat protein [Pseudomonadota bacterium]